MATNAPALKMIFFQIKGVFIIMVGITQRLGRSSPPRSGFHGGQKMGMDRFAS
jgi:hypothetical protein